MHYRPFLLVMAFFGMTFSQTVINISVKGISDGKNDGAQKDRQEAIMDAKRQACEKAGLTLESKTTVSNFTVLNDYVETQSKGVLLPGFQIVDIGYVADGTYQVVLTGKVKTREDEVISTKELRYAKAMNDKKVYAKCREILESYLDSKDESIPEATKEQAHYYYIRWGYARNPEAELDKFASYYPQSKYNDILKSFVQFAQKPLCSLSKSLSVDFSQWKKAAVSVDDNEFGRKIVVFSDTMGFKDFKNDEHSLVATYEFLQSTVKDAKTPFAYIYSVFHYDGAIKKRPASGRTIPPDTVFCEFRPFDESGSRSIQAGRGDVLFNNFKLSDYSFESKVPDTAGVFPQKAHFTVNQVSF